VKGVSGPAAISEDDIRSLLLARNAGGLDEEGELIYRKFLNGEIKIWKPTQKD
jgi:hypothetical protein